MRFSLRLPTHRVDPAEGLGTIEAIGAVARAAEQSGFDAVFVTEHPLPSEDWLRSGGHHALDPFVALSVAAAATRTLRLQTGLCVVPYHPPHLLAKTVASLDAVSGGRVILGAGAGYLEPEFRAVGADFERRHERFDDAIRALRVVWSGEAVAVRAADGSVHSHRALPRPVQRPGPPIWIGGNSRRAIRRAAELGDGWMPFPNPPALAARRGTAAIADLDDLRERIGWLRERSEAAGRDAPPTVQFMPVRARRYGTEAFDPAVAHDELASYREAGVDWTAVAIGGRSLGEILDRVAGYGRDVVAAVRA